MEMQQSISEGPSGPLGNERQPGGDLKVRQRPTDFIQIVCSRREGRRA